MAKYKFKYWYEWHAGVDCLWAADKLIKLSNRQQPPSYKVICYPVCNWFSDHTDHTRYQQSASYPVGVFIIIRYSLPEEKSSQSCVQRRT